MSLPAVIFEERLRIPSEAHQLAPFRLWCAGAEFPEEGRIDFLAGEGRSADGILEAEFPKILNQRI